MTLEKKLEYLSSKRMLVFFSQSDGSEEYTCNIAIVGRKPVKGISSSLYEAFQEAFEKAVFKTQVLKVVAK
jgi:hypothetical protein